MTRRAFLTVTALLLLAGTANAATREFTVTVSAGGRERNNVPVTVPFVLPAAFGGAMSAVVRDDAGKEMAAQVTAPGLLSEGKEPESGEVRRELHFILPRLAAGKTARLKATVSTEPRPSAGGFAWHDATGDYAELRFGDRPVLRYLYRALDESSKASREQTYKVFHHLYDPDGKRLVTKGPGGRFTHHRGLFYGFNKVTYGDGKKADVWHATGDAHQAHAGFLATEAGPVLGRHRVAVHWHGQDKEVFAREEREVTVYHVPGGHLVEFASRLRSAISPVKLDGDPQHAGFHFRADDEVAARTAKQTYYLRPDGPDQPGRTRNWPAQKNHVNLPWDAMSFVLGGTRYTVAYLDRPQNPKEARFSERDYGRFGSYFEYTLDATKPLTVGYRLWLQEGEMTVPEVAARSANFVDPVAVKVE